MSAGIEGEFMHPVYDSSFDNNDAWQRKYYIPPKWEKLDPRTHTLNDIRPALAQDDYQPVNLLKTHGFGVVNHRSSLVDDIVAAEGAERETVIESYKEETKGLLRKTLGVKEVFVTSVVLRQGKSNPEPYQLPTQKVTAPTKDDNPNPAQKTQQQDDKEKKMDLMKALAIGKPVRLPHMDQTPLGARQTIRFLAPPIHKAAVNANIIDTEDRLCVNSTDKAHVAGSKSLFEHGYNRPGEPSPRYAAYSIWRPLRTVGRDPLAVGPWKPSMDGKSGLKYWPYHNRIPGPVELGGDFLQEYAVLATVEGEASTCGEEGGLRWYYVSKQTPEEVLLIKLFDSAALGEGSEEAGAPWHGSPEVGSAQGQEARESVEVRVFAFW